MIELIDKLILRLILLFSICTLLIVFIAELVYGLEPCTLCKYQRIPYFSVIVFSSLALHIKLADQTGTLKIISIIFIASAILAFYHNGIEQQWWDAATTCGDTNQFSASFTNFQSQLMSKMPKRCDVIDWTLFGLSMTVYNMVLSIILGGLAFFGVSFSNKS
jgi:disulfide bond formation protein DsbB